MGSIVSSENEGPSDKQLVSESSSMDEHQCCGHWTSEEHPDRCCICDADIPAEPERRDPDCIRLTGCRDLLKRGCAHGCAEAADEATRLGEEMEAAQPPRRPSYVVSYVLQDGSVFEVAVPTATVGVFNGALIITHESPVKGLVQIKPLEGA